MSLATADLRIRAQKPLPIPAELARAIPLATVAAEGIAEARAAIADIICGEDDRLLVVAGPCSIHDPESALDYARRLREIAVQRQRELLVVMRVYFEKPRTVAGWKGLINDPNLDGSYDINRGLAVARTLMRDIAELGLPIGTEFLDTTLGQYYADLVSWGAIGARTVESQVHRELASGLSMPVGFKNRTDGEVGVAVDAMRSASRPHWFPSLTREGAPAALGTSGNRDTHVVLRGGARGPNYSREDVAAALARLREHRLPPRVMVDCSHANSGKDPARQPLVARDLAGRIADGDGSLLGVMVESHLLGGAQDIAAQPLVYGRSVTDPCLAWEQTLPLFDELATAVAARRARTA